VTVFATPVIISATVVIFSVTVVIVSFSEGNVSFSRMTGIVACMSVCVRCGLFSVSGVFVSYVRVNLLIYRLTEGR
jgi:hypothetical protein